MRSTRRLPAAFATAAAVLALAVTGFGCVAHSEIMTPVPPTRIEPEPGYAVVVFVRPSAYAAIKLIPVVDGDGNLLGESEQASRFAVAVAPGEHLFAAWAANTSPVHATLLPGYIYAIEVSVRPGLFGPRVQLLPVKPSKSSWPKLGEWLTATTLLSRRPDVPTSIDPKTIADHLESARENLSEFDRDDLDLHTMEPTDAYGALETEASKRAE